MLDLLHSMPNIVMILSLVVLHEIDDNDCLLKVQEYVSGGCLLNYTKWASQR
jgi:hypothetical protein